MKIIGYLIFSFFYHIFLICRVRKNKVYCIMHHDSSRDSNVGMVIQYLKELSDKYQFSYITKKDVNGIKGKGIIKNFIPFFIVKSYHLATSNYVLLDDAFIPLAYLKFRKGVKVIQLWHGTGTIKKFGQDVNTGKLKELEYKVNQNITHLIVNSYKIIDQYSGAFGVEKSKVYPLGLPRTDTLFRKEKLENEVNMFYIKYPELKDKKIILYAPTFRDLETDNPKIHLDYSKLLEGISKDWILMLKLHPFVANAFHLSEEEKNICKGRLYDFSFYPDLNTLMGVSSVLVTDYSSIIFEYCLQNKPMIFYTYDLAEFSDQGRGFYESYDIFVPGPIAHTTKDLTQILNKNTYDMERITKFREDNFDYLDGQSTKRLVENIFN